MTSYQKASTIDGEDCILSIIDTAGQEEYRSMRDQYMRSGQGFLVVYSITSKVSFTEVANLKNQIIRVKEVDSAPVVFVGNKCDLESERQVPKSDGNEAATTFGCPFFETSAKANINVENSFFQLVREIKKDLSAVSSGDDKNDKKKEKCLVM